MRKRWPRCAMWKASARRIPRTCCTRWGHARSAGPARRSRPRLPPRAERVGKSRCAAPDRAIFCTSWHALRRRRAIRAPCRFTSRRASSPSQWGTIQELGEVLRELADVHRDGGRLALAIQNYQAALSTTSPRRFSPASGSIRCATWAAPTLRWSATTRPATVWTEALDLSRDLPDSVAARNRPDPSRHRGSVPQPGPVHRGRTSRTARRCATSTAGSVPAAATWRTLGRTSTPPGGRWTRSNRCSAALEAEKVTAAAGQRASCPDSASPGGGA